MHLNYETLVEAVQEYIDKRFVNPPVVKSLHSMQVYNNSTEHSGTMIVEVQENGEFLQGAKT